MGVIEFFGTLIRSDITSGSIKSDYRGKLSVDHLFIDFNSIIYGSSAEVLSGINRFMKQVLSARYQNKSFHQDLLSLFSSYKMASMPKDTGPDDIIDLFHEHFDNGYVEKLIITNVVKTLLKIVSDYCKDSDLKTVLVAIDGVPSKGKMVEQRQRRYLGAITESYENKMLDSYAGYLLKKPDYLYLATKSPITWGTVNITPGTKFMDKMASYLRSEQVVSLMKKNRDIEYIVSDTHEIGEGEKKMVNYIKHKIDKKDTVMLYSPDADVILLCMLLEQETVYMLRQDAQASGRAGRNVYDVIDIKQLEGNISYYVNRNVTDFDQKSIAYDIVCVSTLFGNDFVPRIETISVKNNFQLVIDAYYTTLKQLKEHLVTQDLATHQFSLNYDFLKQLITYLLPLEEDFIENNSLYNRYMNLGQIKLVFDYATINEKTLVPLFQEFTRTYGELKNNLSQNRDVSSFEADQQFIESLKKALDVKINNKPINTQALDTEELMTMLRDYYEAQKKFPNLNISLKTRSHSIKDSYRQFMIKRDKLNDYEIEKYQFNNMLDQYYIKFNAQPLDLSPKGIPSFYLDYFGTQAGTKEMNMIMQHYLEGILWVFNYYFNSDAYISTWYYPHERAPLLRDFSNYLKKVSMKDYDTLLRSLVKYDVTDIRKYFNPLEQFVNVSPRVPKVVDLLPENYQKAEEVDPFLENYFVDINRLTDILYSAKESSDVDCHSIPYLNKCLFKSLGKPTRADDRAFLRAIRKIKPSPESEKLAANSIPDF